LTLNKQEIISLRPAEGKNRAPALSTLSFLTLKVVLIGYIWCYCPIQHKRAIIGGSTDDEPKIQQFKWTTRRVDMSWIMRQPKSASILRSMHYRAGFDLLYLAIPEHGADFFQLFLQHIHHQWVTLFEDAKLHLDAIVGFSLIPVCRLHRP
jgi:hypothetical protein